MPLENFLNICKLKSVYSLRILEGWDDFATTFLLGIGLHIHMYTYTFGYIYSCPGNSYPVYSSITRTVSLLHCSLCLNVTFADNNR